LCLRTHSTDNAERQQVGKQNLQHIVSFNKRHNSPSHTELSQLMNARIYIHNLCSPFNLSPITSLTPLQTTQTAKPVAPLPHVFHLADLYCNRFVRHINLFICLKMICYVSPNPTAYFVCLLLHWCSAHIFSFQLSPSCLK